MPSGVGGESGVTTIERVRPRARAPSVNGGSVVARVNLYSWRATTSGERVKILLVQDQWVLGQPVPGNGLPTNLAHLHEVGFLDSFPQNLRWTIRRSVLSWIRRN